MNIIEAKGIQYRRMEVVDAWGRRRVCDKRLSDLPQPHAETCAVCGQPIQAQRSTMKFCSTKCRMTAYRQRQRGNVE